MDHFWHFNLLIFTYFSPFFTHYDLFTPFFYNTTPSLSKIAEKQAYFYTFKCNVLRKEIYFRKSFCSWLAKSFIFFYDKNVIAQGSYKIYVVCLLQFFSCTGKWLPTPVFVCFVYDLSLELLALSKIKIL